ncbi:GPP34 family phosphoprotein [Blastococcus sp. PRF04-17]|uniref:GPP34 family phosphoprotein n=1 Tax=Blastococcus sp. PRF04-17 TaxID=2933797 RepID=UPI001FF595DF|nr:GPP34 family phosphoprotein [Blastococcus sp. PRF04-17]UOY02746.1 GPP34 family phosphoprotein [Blastococcus sp. PRF04-17]
MNPEEGITVRLAALCLDDKGRLLDYGLWDVAARGALLVDLARAGRLTDEPDGVVVDGTPTAFGPADRLLAAVLIEPEQSLDWWLEHGGVRMREVAEACVAAGLWTESRSLLGTRYTDHTPLADQELDPEHPDTAAVLALATACGALGPPDEIGEEQLVRTGPLRWICEAVTDHLHRSHRRNLGIGAAGPF